MEIGQLVGALGRKTNVDTNAKQKHWNMHQIGNHQETLQFCLKASGRQLNWFWVKKTPKGPLLAQIGP